MIDFKNIGYFFYPKTILFFTSISKEDNILPLISKKCNVTYSYCFKIMKKLEEEGLIKLEEKDKRTNFIILTEIGKKVQDLLLKINELIKKRG